MDLQIALDHRAQVEQFRHKYRTGLVTLLFTDIVGSTKLKQALGDREAVAVMHHHHALVREILLQFPDGQEISTAGDSFFLVFIKPSDAVRFALLLQARLREQNQGSSHPVLDRIGIHIGEVVIEEREGAAKPRDLYGMQVDSCARVMSLGAGNQILLTRSAFDNARQALKGEETAGLGALSWLNHGTYQLAGVEEPVEICEVGEANLAALKQPPDSEKARRAVAGDQETVLGWRPALDQAVPGTRWVLENKLGEGAFGEVWLGRHQTLKERRVFKFCFRAEQARTLKREMTLFKLLKERVGDHPNIVRLLEVNFEEPPFYVVMDHVEGQDLRTWSAERGGVGSVPLEVRLEIVAQVADALQAAHDAGVIHRDVKPGNILIADRVRFADCENPQSEIRSSKLGVKLTDFGIGQVISEEHLSGVTRAGFTQTMLSGSSSSQAGTQMYMAPELLAGKPASIRSDIYSLGVVLYQLLVNDFSRPVTTDWARDISDPLLRDDLQHCFAGNPTDRFAGVGQLAKGLRSLPQRQSALAEREKAQRAAQRRRTVATMTTAVAVILLLLAVALGYGLRRARIEMFKARQNLYAADMSLAQQALATGNLGGAQYFLERHRPKTGEEDLRDWEWRYLWRLCRSDELFPLYTHSNAVSTVAFSTNGNLLATASHDGTVRLWDTTTTNEIGILQHEDAVIALAFSPDGQTLATGCNDDKVRLWDVATRHETAQFPEKVRTDRNRAFTFSPDGQVLATANDDGVHLWNVNTKSQLGVLLKHSYVQNALAFSPDGRTLASGGSDRMIRLWDVTTQSSITNLSGHALQVYSLAFSPDGRSLVSGSSDRTVKVWEVATWRERASLTGHAATVFDIGFAPDRKTLATASSDQKIKLWDVTTWQEITTLKGHLSEVWTLAFAADSQALVSGCKDGTVKFWSTIPKLKETNPVVFPAETFGFARAISSDGKTFAARDAQDAIRFWSLNTLQEMTNLLVKVSQLNTMAVSPDGRLLAAGSRDGRVRLLDAAMNREIASLAGHTNTVRESMFSVDGKLLATGSVDGTIKLWDVAAKRELTTFRGHTQNVSALRFSQDGSMLASGSFDRTVKLWDVAKKRERGTLKGHRMSVNTVAFSLDGTMLASTGMDEMAILWDVATQREIKTFMGQMLSYHSVAFSKDGLRLAAGTGAGTVKLWDTGTHQEVGTLRGHTGFVTATIFLGDDTFITASGNELLVWRGASFAEIDAAEKTKVAR